MNQYLNPHSRKKLRRRSVKLTPKNLCFSAEKSLFFSHTKFVILVLIFAIFHLELKYFELRKIWAFETIFNRHNIKKSPNFATNKKCIRFHLKNLCFWAPKSLEQCSRAPLFLLWGILLATFLPTLNYISHNIIKAWERGAPD